MRRVGCIIAAIVEARRAESGSSIAHDLSWTKNRTKQGRRPDASQATSGRAGAENGICQLGITTESIT